MSGQVIFNSYCVPASCSPEMVIGFLNQEFFLKNDLFAVGTMCRTDDPFPFEVMDVVAM